MTSRPATLEPPTRVAISRDVRVFVMICPPYHVGVEICVTCYAMSHNVARDWRKMPWFRQELASEPNCGWYD